MPQTGELLVTFPVRYGRPGVGLLMIKLPFTFTSAGLVPDIINVGNLSPEALFCSTRDCGVETHFWRQMTYGGKRLDLVQFFLLGFFFWECLVLSQNLVRTLSVLGGWAWGAGREACFVILISWHFWSMAVAHVLSLKLQVLMRFYWWPAFIWNINPFLLIPVEWHFTATGDRTRFSN